jgi:hypothetical protein
MSDTMQSTVPFDFGVSALKLGGGMTTSNRERGFSVYLASINEIVTV